MDESGARYKRYEASLSALQMIPPKLVTELESARTAREDARKAATTAYHQHITRITSLRRTLQARYEAAIATLKEHQIFLPLQIRGATDVSAEEKDIVRAIKAQAAAVAAVNTSVSETTARAEKEATSRAADARIAAAALRLRQENLHRDRREAADRARLMAEKARRRTILVMAALALILLTSAVIGFTVFNHN